MLKSTLTLILALTAAASAASAQMNTASSSVSNGVAATTTTASKIKKPFLGMGKPKAVANAVTTATTAKGSTMKACGAQWSALSAAQKSAYNTQAMTMKSKSGGKLTGYNVFSAQCLKKK